MELSKFDFELPEELIAQYPAQPRESSRLMIIDKEKGLVREDIFAHLGNYLKKGDVLVFNQSKVIPARLLGHKKSGGKVEVMLLRVIQDHTWEALCKPGLKTGSEVWFDTLRKARVVEVREEGVVWVELNFGRRELEKFGKTPVPPYIKSKISEEELRIKYQTIYAKDEGSVAAPTAGFHFSGKLIKDLEDRGVATVFVTLHVSLGTFRGVKTANIEDHKMHAEFFNLSKSNAERLNRFKEEGRRIICVGTTATRVLESCADSRGKLSAKTGETEIFIYPSYKFRFVDGLITNFHLPKSTLLMMVSAFVSKPNTNREFTSFVKTVVGKAYLEAVEKKFRFFSFGDGMIIL